MTTIRTSTASEPAWVRLTPRAAPGTVEER